MHSMWAGQGVEEKPEIFSDGSGHEVQPATEELRRHDLPSQISLSTSPRCRSALCNADTVVWAPAEPPRPDAAPATSFHLEQSQAYSGSLHAQLMSILVYTSLYLVRSVHWRLWVLQGTRLKTAPTLLSQPFCWNPEASRNLRRHVHSLTTLNRKE